jgi:hypothetical protein
VTERSDLPRPASIPPHFVAIHEQQNGQHAGQSIAQRRDAIPRRQRNSSDYCVDKMLMGHRLTVDAESTNGVLAAAAQCR